VAEGKNLQRELKKKKFKCTHLMLRPQIHVKSKGLLTSKVDLSIFRIWCWRIFLPAINQFCFASATRVGIYTCMNQGPYLPPGYSRETSRDCTHSPVPVFPQKATELHSFPRAEPDINGGIFSLPSRASHSFCKNPASFQCGRVRPPSSESFPYKILPFKSISIPARTF